MQFEELLSRISKSGPCYRWLITILVAVSSMKVAFSMFVLNLATSSVPYHCAQALVDNKTTSLSDVLANLTISGNFSALDYTCALPVFQTGADGFLITTNATGNNSVACQSWIYLPDPPSRWTMFMEYNMVCERKYLVDRLQTVLQIGVCVSNFLGPLGDVYGRKTFFLLVVYLDFACSIAIIFARDLTVQMVLLFFTGFGAQSSLIGLILIVELVSEEYRSVHGNLQWIVYLIGYCGSAGICYYVFNWRLQIVAVVVIVGVAYSTYIPVVPESPRWLLTRGRTGRAERILKEMCKYSGCKEALSEFNVECNDLVNTSILLGEDKNCLFKLFPRDKFCRLEYLVAFSVITFNFLTVSLVYYALSFQRDFITKDPYLNVVISGLLELPSYIVAWQLMNRVGRKYTTVVAMGLCGLGLIVLPYIPANPNLVFQASSGVAIAIKFCVSVAYSVVLVYSSEVLPTRVRSCSFFIASIPQGVGLVLAPELGGLLASLYEHLAYLFYGTICVIACLVLLLLPETRNKLMPSTVAEMEPMRLCCCSAETPSGGRRCDETGNNAAGSEELKPLHT